MVAWLRQFLSAPDAPGDPERTALARIFYIFAVTAFVALSAATVNNLLFSETGTPIVIPASVVAVGALIAAARLGYFRFASASLPLVLLAVFTDVMLVRDGTHGVAIAAITGVLVFAGVMLKRRALAVFTAAASIVILAVGYAEIAGLLHNRMSGFTTVRQLIGICLVYIVIAVIARVLTESLFTGLREAREKGAEALRAQDRADLAAQASKASLWEWDIRRGTAHFDKGWTSLLGSEPRETYMTVQELESMVHPDDLHGARQAQGECIKGQTAEYALEFRVRSQSTGWIWVMNRGRVVERDAAGRALRMAGIVLDVTARKKAELLLGQSEERFAKIFQASPDAIVISRLSDGRYLEVNQRWLELFGYSREELVGRSSLDLGTWVDPEDRTRFVEQIRERGALRDFETRFLVKSGAVIDALISAELIDIDGEPHVIVPILDITDRKRAEERIQQLATRDALTGLPNRLLLNDRLGLSISQAQRNQGCLAVFFVGLDRFKYINDSLGHAIGDAFLKAVAERLSGVVRKGDTLARLGGDEFVVLLENVKALEDEAGQLARKILISFAQPFSVAGHSLRCSCSIGISVFPSDTTDPQTLLRDADTAMHHVKESARGSYRYFSPGMNARMQERLQLENGLRDAIAGRQFTVVYQPKVDVAGGQITGLEALLRWRHPSLGVVSPAQFISVAEDTGLIVDIGHWVLEDVCRQVRDWRRAGLPLHPVAVNLSVRQFTPALVGEISNLLKKFDVDPDLIEVEITESLFLKESGDISATLKGLAQVGTRVMIDDFGAGYSSLSYIKHFPVNGLKIDRSFVSDLATSPQDVAIVRAIITMARGLGIRVIAEGVETHDQLELLRKHHCNEYQGFLFSVPLVADQIERRYLRVAGATYPSPANRIA